MHPGDVVELDDNVIEWQRLTLDVKTQDFIYIKHWKRPGVICTTDPEIPSNIISQIPPIPQQSSDRIFPIGRLDDASSGLILLTSDGRLPNAVLGASKRCAKKYLVVPDMRVSDEDVEHLRGGVAITTVTRRDGFVHRPRTARTLPCEVERGEGFELFITLFEGRNRQIRKMLGALGYTTRDIHRVEFMGIGLDGLESPGDVCVLNDAEMEMINRKLNEVAS